MNFLHKLFGKYKYITMSAIILLLIIGIIFVCIHFYSDNNTDPIDNSAIIQTERQSITHENDGTLSGDSCILLVCNGDKIGDAVFMALLDFNIFAERIIVTPLDMTVSDGTKTYAQNYAYGGINDLVDSIEKVRNCYIDRYVTINNEGISSLTDILGPVNLYVSEEYTYASSDKSYTVESGYNDLEASMLYTFLKINSKSADGGKKIAQLLCTIINSYLKDVKPEEAHELFGELCNCVNTDITIADYYTCSSDIEYLITHDTQCVVFDEGV